MQHNQLKLEDVKRNTYITYGWDHFNKDKFVPVRNNNYINKPFGGLWACNAKSNDWYNFCKSEDFKAESLSKHFKFKLSADARILMFDSVYNVLYCPQIKDPIIMFDNIKSVYPDFEEISKYFDAIWYSKSRYQLYYMLYGWDVDSLLVLNPDIIIPTN